MSDDNQRWTIQKYKDGLQLIDDNGNRVAAARTLSHAMELLAEVTIECRRLQASINNTRKAAEAARENDE